MARCASAISRRWLRALALLALSLLRSPQLAAQVTIWVQDCKFTNTNVGNNGTACALPNTGDIGPANDTTITAGQTVQFEWTTPSGPTQSHTASSTSSVSFSFCPAGCSGIPSPNPQGPTPAFTGVGDYTYQCNIHGPPMSGTIHVVPAGLDHFTISAPGSATAGTPFSITVSAFDVYGNLATNYGGTVHFTSNDGQATLPADTTLSSGQGTFMVTLGTDTAVLGTATIITATDTNTTFKGGNSNGITVSPGPANKYNVSAGSPQAAGTSFTVNLQAADFYGNPVSGYGATLTNITSSDGQAVLPSPSSVTVSNSTGSFIATLKTAGPQTISVFDGALPGMSNSINVTAIAATHFSVSGPPSIDSGSVFSITVKALDPFGNIDPSYAGSVTFTSTDGSATLPSPNPAPVPGGQAMFSMTLATPGAQTVSAADLSISNSKGTSGTIAVRAPCPDAPKTFKNTAPISMPTTAGGGSPYPSPITVSGMPGFIGKITVTVNGFANDCQGAFGFLLVGPGGQTLVLQSEAGSCSFPSASPTVSSITFDDAASSVLPNCCGPDITAGSFKPSSYHQTDTAAPPPFPGAPGAPFNLAQPDGAATLASVFRGTDPNGTWNLYATSEFSCCAGSLDGGWSLTITAQQKFESDSQIITIPSTGPGVLYPSTVNVSGLPGNITNMRVRLNNFTSDCQADPAFLLVGPFGQNIVLASDTGGCTPGSSTTVSSIILDDGAASPLPACCASNFTAGIYRPASYFPPFFTGVTGPFAEPATDGSATFASQFKGTDPNGTWSLYALSQFAVTNSHLGDGIAPTWSLIFETDCPADSATQLMSSVNPSSFNQGVTLTATVTSTQGTPFGNVEFLEGAVVIATVPLTSGVAMFAPPTLSVGTHNFTAIYLGNTTFESSTSSVLVQTVKKAAAPLTLTSSGSPSIVNSAVTFTAKLTPAFGGTTTGTITFKDGVSTIAGSPVGVFGNTAAISTSSLSIGGHNISATYTGDADFNGSTNSLSQVVTPGPATHFVLSAPATTAAGSSFSITVTTYDQFGNVATGYAGTVHFTSSDPHPATLPANTLLSSGTGTFSATLFTASSQTITATDTVTASITSGPVSVAVTPLAATHLKVTSPSPVTAGIQFSITVTAQDLYNNTATGYSGTVKITSSDAQATLPSNSKLINGAELFNVTLGTVGSQSVTATDTVTASITGFVSIGVNPGAATHYLFKALPASVTAGNSFAFRLTALDVDGNQATGYTGTVHFTSSDPHPATLPANSTLTNGTAIFNATLFTTPSETITATDTVTSSITATATETVNPAATSKLSVTAPASVNAGVAFNITVNSQDAFGNSTPAYGGTVHFTSTDPLATLAADTTLTSGTGTFASKLQTVGSRTITGTDTVTNTITGISGAITVAKSNTTVTLAAGINPMYFRHRGTLVATVHVTGGSGKTTGTVQFKEGTKVLGTIAVAANGTASISLPGLRFGTHSITGTYSGDGNYNGSASSAYSLLLRPAP